MTKTTSNEKGKTESLTPGQVMFRMEKRQKEEGYEFGWISHGIRSEKGNALADDAVVTALAARGFDMEDAYQFLNSRTGRHLGDWLTGAGEKEGFHERLAKIRWIPETPEAMYRDFVMAKDTTHPWAGVRISLRNTLGKGR